MPSETAEDDEQIAEYQLGSRAHRLHLIKSWLIPILDTPEWREKYEPDSDSVEKAADILAEEYYDLAIPEFYSAIALIVLLGLIDYLVRFNTQIYGLFLDIWASIFLIFPSLKGRYVIATAVEGTPAEAIYRLESQEMVSANTGFLFLALGFFLQVISVQFLTAQELLSMNLLAIYFPSWVTGVLLILAVAISSILLAYLRDKRLSGREDD